MIRIHATAARTFIKELDIFYTIPSVQLQDNDKTGIDIKAPGVSLEDVWVWGAGYGIYNVPGAGGNTNWGFLKNVTVEQCRRAGLTTRGLDCSANTYIAVKAYVCQNHFDNAGSYGVVNNFGPANGHGPAIGIEESAANGSTYIGCNVELTGAPEVSHGLFINPSGGQAPSTFVGTYVEAGDTIEWDGASSRTTVVGGHLAYRDDTPNDRVGAGNSHLRFRAKDSNGIAYSVNIPEPDHFSALSWQSGDSANDWWFLKRESSGTTYRWVVQHFFKQANDLLGLQATFTDPTWAVTPIVQGVI